MPSVEKTVDSFNKWRPVLLRGGLYFVIAWLTPFVGTIKQVGPTVVQNTWQYSDWLLLNAECLLAGLLVVRVYIDGSFKQHSDKVDDGVKTTPPV